MSPARQVRSLVAIVLGVAVVQGWAPAAAADPIPFSAVRLVIEQNVTDGDAGIQVFFDGEAWEEVRIEAPSGKTLLHIRAKGAVKQLGLTEVFFESEEPSLAEILDQFPAGEYLFRGRTVEGDRLQGVATLSHDLPDAPAILAPPSDVPVDPGATVISWGAVAGVAGYQVIVEQDDLGVSLAVDVPASTTSLSVPPQFLQADTTYALEVVAIAPNGNRSIRESTFTTAP